MLRRPDADLLRQALTVGAVVGGIASGATGDYRPAGDSDETLLPAGWAFAVWAPLYAGSLAFAAYQGRPSRRTDPELRAIGVHVAAACAGAGLWVRVNRSPAAYLGVVAATTVAANAAHGRLTAPAASVDATRAWCVHRPIAGLAGWLTLATAVSGPEMVARLLRRDVAASERAWALPVLGGAVAVVLARAVRHPVSVAYPLVVAWGLLGTAVRQRRRVPAVAALAGAASAALTAVGAVQAVAPLRLRRRRGATG